jgi:hypothetical protein
MSKTPSIETPKQPETLFIHSILGRIVEYVNYRRAAENGPTSRPPAKRHGEVDKRFSIGWLARKTGLNYHALYHIFVERRNVLTPEVADTILFVLGMDVLDLVRESEILAKFPAVDASRVAKGRRLAAKARVHSAPRLRRASIKPLESPTSADSEIGLDKPLPIRQTESSATDADEDLDFLTPDI